MSEIAQKVKVRTGQQLKKYYDRLTTTGIEARKQGTRFLKEKIVEKAPEVGDINARLKSLYEFEEALSKASGRIGKLNLLGLGTKLGAATGGIKGSVIGAIADLIDKPVIKSATAIGLDVLSKGATGGQITLSTLFGNIKKLLEQKEE